MEYLLNKSSAVSMVPVETDMDKPSHFEFPVYKHDSYNSYTREKYKRSFKSPFDTDSNDLCKQWDQCTLNPNVNIKKKGGIDKAYEKPMPYGSKHINKSKRKKAARIAKK